MSNTLGNPTFYSTKWRENEVLASNATLTSAPSVANPLLRVRNGSTTLVDFPLDPTTPMTGGAVDGIAAFAFVGPNAVATGGSATIADNYQVIGRDAVVHASGPAACTDGISAGQTVANSAITLTAPPS